MNPIKLCPYVLIDQIEILREEMVTLGLNEGLGSEQTIKTSEKLDHYIAIYLSLKNRTNEWCYLR